jgi:hypothetical protein
MHGGAGRQLSAACAPILALGARNQDRYEDHRLASRERYGQQLAGVTPVAGSGKLRQWPPEGRMFWLSWNRLVGSYRSFTSTRRA